MQAVDCFKGLIGFTIDNDCLVNVPNDIDNTSLSGLYMDKHPLFSMMVVKGPNQNWSQSAIWDHIRVVDQEARIELQKLLTLEIRKKVTPTVGIRRIEIGENRGDGHLSDSNVEAFGEITTKNVPDAVFLLTHLGIRGRLIGAETSTTVKLYKNNTLITGWSIPLKDLTSDRQVLSVPYQLALDGSTYRLQYPFPTGFYPVKNPIGCGCQSELETLGCFFQPATDGQHLGGLRLLGEISCNGAIWPCEVGKSGDAGQFVASLYRAILIKMLMLRLHSSFAGKINGLTLIPANERKANYDALDLEIITQLNGFTSVWQPVNSCCWNVKSLVELGNS